MTTRVPKTAIGFLLDRNFSPKLGGQIGQTLEASGVVDEYLSWDGWAWWPTALWQPDVTPLAKVICDQDSQLEGMLVAAFVAAATERLGITVSTDATRRGPAEMMQSALTLANATEGNATILVGAGEAKQTTPFGWNRKEGLARMEDHFRIYQLLWEATEPVDFEGNHWKFTKAFIGNAKPHRPKFWAMGSGPKLREIAAKYADGWSSCAPSSFANPEQYAEEVALFKTELERNGRDPEQFEFGLWFLNAIHDDAAVIEQAKQNPLIKFAAATWGRFNSNDWEKEGIESAWPPNWHYALKLLPAQMTRAECDAIVERVSPKMVDVGLISGTAKEVASQIQGYIDAGATWVSPLNMISATFPAEEVQSVMLDQAIEVCRHIKGG